jgi:hypothetical protein
MLIGLEPLDGFSEILLERMPSFKPKERFRPGDIQSAARLSIG